MSMTLGPTVPDISGSTTCFPLLLSISVTFSLVCAADLAAELLVFIDGILGSAVVRRNMT